MNKYLLSQPRCMPVKIKLPSSREILGSKDKKPQSNKSYNMVKESKQVKTHLLL